MNLGIIGVGAIGAYVRQGLEQRGHSIGALLVRPERVRELADELPGPLYVGCVADLPDDIDLMIDCAGQSALKMHGPAILRRGFDLLTVSIGALAHADLTTELEQAAEHGKATLHLASGAIGALDCLRAAGAGRIDSVTYTGTKPPAGWKGSPAEQQLDLERLSGEAQLHFAGSAREAALRYPKNANVAAAVALAGVGMDQTQVRLIADPNVDQNIHEVLAAGEFGQFRFEIRGNALPGNPKSSALAAMSVVSQVEHMTQRIRF